MTATFMHVNFDAPRYMILVTTMRLPSLLRTGSAAGAPRCQTISLKTSAGATATFEIYGEQEGANIKWGGGGGVGEESGIAW